MADPDAAGYPPSAPPPDVKEARKPYPGNRGDQQDSIAGLVETAHLFLAQFLGPEWECSKEEARKVARPLVQLSELYSVDMARYAKPLAWGALARALIDVEGPRLKQTISQPRAKRGPRTERTADGTIIIDADPPRPEVYIPD